MGKQRRTVGEVSPYERRLGRTPESALRWVLRFLAVDLDTLHPGELAALAYDLGLLAMTGPGPRPLVARSGPIPKADLHAIQQEINQAILGLLVKPPQKTPRWWALPRNQAYVMREVPGGRFQVRWMPGRRADAIILGVVGVLLAAGDRLRLCPVCETPFVKNKRQDYCSTACSQRARNQRKK